MIKERFFFLNCASELGALRGRTSRQHAATERHEDQTEPVDARERRRAGECTEVQQGRYTCKHPLTQTHNI